MGEGNWVPAAQRIVEERQYRFVHPNTGRLCSKGRGVRLDLFSASAMLKVWEALSDGNRLKFQQMPVGKAAEVAFKLLN